MTAPHPEPEQVSYRPLSARRRWLVLLLAIATGIAVTLMLFYPPGGVKRVRPPPAPCRDGEQERCVGGKADVVIVPAEASAPR